jgi:FtsP/CotA-like multicopper oxidase with cupredoxin domain
MAVIPVHQRRYTDPQLLAETDWLAGQLNNPNVRIVDARPPQQYVAAHIPGVVNLPGMNGIPRAADGEIASAEEFSSVAGKLAIGNVGTIIGGFNRSTINGKSWPDVKPLPVKQGRRYRVMMENRSGDDHPVHFHRHTFEIIRIGGNATSGIRKDTVNVPRRQSVEIDFGADDPGLTLYHCHMQLHMDFGFMALMKYA